jgi:hypothetical protein
MTERKPPGMDFETWIDRQVREARERGEFDDLPGTGKPLPGLDEPFTMDRWIVERIRREGLDAEALLPEPLRLRKEIERLPEAVAGLRSERAVRALVDELNGRIKESLRRPSELPVMVFPVDADAVVERWRTSREAEEKAAAHAPRPSAGGAAEVAEAPHRRGGWLRRFWRHTGINRWFRPNRNDVSR